MEKNSSLVILKKNMFMIGLGLDAYSLISFKLDMIIDITRQHF